MKNLKRFLGHAWRLGLPLTVGRYPPLMVNLLLDIRRSQSDFDQQVTESVEALQKTSALVKSLEEGLRAQMEKLRHVKEEHDKYSGLAQIEEKKAKPLLTQLEASLERNASKERWIALAMHLGVFVAGVWLSDPLKGWIEHLWRKFTS
jgi:hypothetical protein